MSTTYKSYPLTTEEKDSFLKLFYTIDIFVSSEIKIKPLKNLSGYYDSFEITFTPLNEEGERLVKESFEVRTLKVQGWGRKFFTDKKHTTYKTKPLNSVERDAFLKHFYDLEIKAGSGIFISPIEYISEHKGKCMYEISISVLNNSGIWDELIKKSFEEGLMSESGCSVQ